MKWRLSDVARQTNGRVVGADVAFNGVATDSRTLKTGALYVALRGERFDGHDFAGVHPEVDVLR